MQPIKIAIFGEVKKHDEELANLTNEELNKLFFHHADGLRLSLRGFVQVKAIFTAYSFGIPETIKAKHRFALSKMEFPYFFTNKRLILFSEMDAMMVKLHGGIENFLEVYC